MHQFLLRGGGILAIDSVLLGSILIPCLETMNPKILPSSTAKIYFFGIERYIILLKYVEYSSQMGYMIFFVFGEDNGII
jgi:hypothetical protein